MPPASLGAGREWEPGEHAVSGKAPYFQSRLGYVCKSGEGVIWNKTLKLSRNKRQGVRQKQFRWKWTVWTNNPRHQKASKTKQNKKQTHPVSNTRGHSEGQHHRLMSKAGKNSSLRLKSALEMSLVPGRISLKSQALPMHMKVYTDVDQR